MIKAKFIERKNRFTGIVELADSQIVPVHIANSGRLRELFEPGSEVHLIRQDGAHRLTQYDLALVKYKERFVSVDARVPNEVVSKAIATSELKEFAGLQMVRREVKFGDSRLDILLDDSQGNMCYVEVKSCTLVVGDTAKFPDAPTERGTRHLTELARAIKEGHRAAVVFLVQRDDAVRFAPNDDTDPVFGQTLREVVDRGVEVYAYICEVTPHHIGIVKSIPVELAACEY